MTSNLQNPDKDNPNFWRRQFALETDRRLSFANTQGYRVLPITAPLEGYIVTFGGQVIARCNLLMEAAEVAAALAYFKIHGGC